MFLKVLLFSFYRKKIVLMFVQGNRIPFRLQMHKYSTMKTPVTSFQSHETMECSSQLEAHEN